MSKRRNRKRSGGIAREDYRTGGRVGYQEGGRFEYDQISGLKNQQEYIYKGLYTDNSVDKDMAANEQALKAVLKSSEV